MVTELSTDIVPICYFPYICILSYSLQHLDSWVNDFKEQCPDADVIIAGNKCDIPAQGRQVSLAEAEQFAADRGFVHIECSAKANINVQSLFGKVGITLFRKTFPGETDAEIA